MKTSIAPNVSWPFEPPPKKVRKKRVYVKKIKLKPVEIDYFKEAREQIAEMIRKRMKQ